MTSAPTDLAYAAGVIDSDGWIGVHRNTYAARVRGDATQAVYSPRVAVKQVTPQALDLLHLLFGGHRYDSKPSAARGRPLLTWQVHSAAAGRVLQQLLPYLRIKREQALNALEVVQMNASGQRRRFALPAVDPTEPMVTMAEAARRLGKGYATVIQSVRLGNVPHLRLGPRRVLIPESYLEVWATRRHSPTRRPDLTERLEALFQRAKELNRVGI
jgi:excisionase family DNA binding protein